MDDTAALPSVAPSAAAQEPPARGLANLFAGALALLAAAFAAMAAVVFLVPEENDYAQATLLKHARLNSAGAHKIVLVGGSNLAFGIDSSIVERETGCTAVNMGMNGYYGVRYMLAEVRERLAPGDVVIIAFEYDNYFKPVEGTGADLLMVVKANPAALGYLTWRQRLLVAQSMPYVAQQKLLRFVGYGFSGLSRLLGLGDNINTRAQIAEIETARGFTPAGDLTTHLGVAWPYEREPGIDLTRNGVDPNVVPMIADFARDMKARGVDVVVSYSPILREFYVRHAAVIGELHRRLTEALPPGAAPSPPEAYVYDAPLFFDTVYHLNAAGRGPRTQQIVRDAARALGGERLQCARAGAPAGEQRQ